VEAYVYLVGVLIEPFVLYPARLQCSILSFIFLFVNMLLDFVSHIRGAAHWLLLLSHLSIFTISVHMAFGLFPF
jgi:hypothetical protein